MAELNRTKENPWVLMTPPGTSEYTMHMDVEDGVKVLVCTVGKTVLLYDARCIADLQPCSKRQAGGSNSAAQMNKNQPRKAQSKPGGVPK